MVLDPDSLLPSGKYMAIFDNLGNAKVMEQPTNQSLLMWDGSDFIPLDGSDEFPIALENLKEDKSPMWHIWGTRAGRLYAFIGANDGVKRLLTSQGTTITWETATMGIPSTGFGLVYRAQYTDPTPPPNPAFLTGPGLVYIATDGTVTPITNGSNGQQLIMQNALPTFINPPAGTVTSGVASIGLFGVAANNTSAAVVNVKAPALTATDLGGTDQKLTAVNVSCDLGASLGVGGLDIGAESSSAWYYVYVLSDGANVGACFSTSGTAPDPTHLGAYTFFVAVGIVRNDGSSNIIPFVQRGRDIWTRQVVLSDPAAITTAYTSIPQGVNLNTILPPNVKTCRGIIGGTNSAPAETQNPATILASDNQGMAATVIPIFHEEDAMEGFKHSYGPFDRQLIIDPASPVLYWKGSQASSRRRVVITGYTI